MIDLAVKANLPLVTIQTRDILNMPEVLETITGKTPVKWLPKTPLKEGTLYYHVQVPGLVLPLFDLYEQMVAHSSTLLLVNMPFAEPSFDAGELPTPKTLMHGLMVGITEDEDLATDLVKGLGGCTIKEAAELSRLTMARDASLTANGIMETRKSGFQSSKGLTQVDTKQVFYIPPQPLQDWLDAEHEFFVNGVDHRLIPRGLLMDGPPGTGKTAAAKWLASKMSLPLYRVDIGGTKNKYVGDSEANLLTNLSRLDHEEPCLALLDEVEKVFSASTNDTSGITSSMLSQMLWWLAERKSRVLVIMTTNNAKALPLELYREGRVDKVMWFGGIDKSEAMTFAAEVLKTFKGFKWVDTDVKTIVDYAMSTSKIKDTNPPMISQAALTTAVYTFVKEHSA